MSIRPSILSFISGVAVLIVLLFWYEKRKVVETALPALNVINSSSSVTTAPNQSASLNALVQTSAPALQLITNAPSSPPQSKWEQLQPILATQNDIPIIFYGRVVDQFSDAVVNATVNFSIGVYNGYESAEQRGQATTDASGLFMITGYRGYNLGIMPEKTGYVLATRDTLFKYSHLENHPYQPDQNNPQIIKMYKLQGAQHLVNFNIKTVVPIDGTSIRFDLRSNRQVQSGGDLSLSIQSPSEPNVQTGYDWKALIQMANGGLIQNPDGLGLENMFQAPDSGYAPEFDLNFQKGTQQWTPRFIDCFYFTTQNNHAYGKIAISIITDRVKNDAIPVSLNGYLNPAGSKNLELNP